MVRKPANFISSNIDDRGEELKYCGATVPAVFAQVVGILRSPKDPHIVVAFVFWDAAYLVCVLVFGSTWKSSSCVARRPA